MNGKYEYQLQCLLLKKRCVHHSIMLPVEPGCQVLFDGQNYFVVAVRKEQLVVIKELTPLPIKEDSVIYIPNWLEDDRCIIIPSIEMLLQVIFDKTGFHPTLVPGVEATREVWKVQHPSVDQPYIFHSAFEALLELSNTLLKK